MFVPESYGLGLAMAFGALVCWGSWSVTLALSGKAMEFQLYYLNFTISFLVTGFVVGFIGGTVGSGGEAYGFTKPYFAEIGGSHETACYIWAMLGGVIWNIANVLLCKGIGMMGNAVGFPLCVGLGMVAGAIVGYIQNPTNNLAFLVPGVIVALCAICTMGLLSHRKDLEIAGHDSEDSSKEDSGDESGGISSDSALDIEVPTKEDAAVVNGPGMVRKLVVCVTGGLFLGLSNIGVGKATDKPCSFSPYANQTYFAIGVFISSAVMVPLVTAYPIEGGKGASLSAILKGYSKVPLKYHILAILGGFVLCAGFFFFNLGNKPLSLTITYCIGQSAPLVAILWGTFFFKEFQGTSCRVWGLVPVVLVLFSSAIALIAASGA
eukprot:TRINITY_DN97846_c0_g1_i1.p1 TRINITY_DN97846_c0_g1~~TRINITY_DN97846_c0_g1_i1.p1  ORF type:complete len:392 (+),score=47.92 TRINITY_DN97846_c0_g1_i1:40-1176(+)